MKENSTDLTQALSSVITTNHIDVREYTEKGNLLVGEILKTLHVNGIMDKTTYDEICRNFSE